MVTITKAPFEDTSQYINGNVTISTNSIHINNDTWEFWYDYDTFHHDTFELCFDVVAYEGTKTMTISDDNSYSISVGTTPKHIRIVSTNQNYVYVDGEYVATIGWNSALDIYFQNHIITNYSISTISTRLEGVVRWLKQWFNTKEEHDAMLFTDSGWQSCTLSSGYTVYTSGTTLRVRKVGKFVEVSGIFKNSNASSTSSTTGVQFATIPSGYRPSAQQTQVCQGSNMNRWLLTINTSGGMFWSRYGTSSYAAASAGSWFPYTITYMVD